MSGSCLQWKSAGQCLLFWLPFLLCLTSPPPYKHFLRPQPVLKSWPQGLLLGGIQIKTECYTSFCCLYLQTARTCLWLVWALIYQCPHTTHTHSHYAGKGLPSFLDISQTRAEKGRVSCQPRTQGFPLEATPSRQVSESHRWPNEELTMWGPWGGSRPGG